MAGVNFVHYIEQKDCTARFATGAISDCKLRVAPATQAGLKSVYSVHVQPRAPLVYFLYGSNRDRLDFYVEVEIILGT